MVRDYVFTRSVQVRCGARHAAALLSFLLAPGSMALGQAVGTAPTTPAVSHAAPNVPGKFDFYVLDMPWGATFCSSVKDTGASCRPQPGFVVNGLWPQNNNDTWPEFCSNVPAGEGMLANLDLTPDPRLLQHEWDKHGTCSGLGTPAYFAATRKARNQVEVPEALLAATTNSTFTPLFLLNMFYLVNPGLPAGSLSLSCRDGRLLAVEACFSKSLQAVACTGLHGCDENTVRLEPLR